MKAILASAATAIGVALLFAGTGAHANEWGHMPAPIIPADNPLTQAAADLGKRLFEETRLSITGEHSCASCHQPHRHFTDGRRTAIGALGDVHPRNTPSLYNVAYNASYGWDDQGVTSLEEQHVIPMFNTEPVELGFSKKSIDSLTSDPHYQLAFQKAFQSTASTTNVIKAIASYLRTIRPPSTAFDRYVFHDEHDALSDAARRGLDLFFSPRLGCSTCHASLTFSGPIRHQASQAKPVFHVTGVSGSRHAFRAPTLRMIRHTAPYMHDGSLGTMEDVLKHYQSVSAPRIPRFQLKDTETQDLIEFLKTL